MWYFYENIPNWFELPYDSDYLHKLYQKTVYMPLLKVPFEAIIVAKHVLITYNIQYNSSLFVINGHWPKIQITCIKQPRSCLKCDDILCQKLQNQVV